MPSMMETQRGKKAQMAELMEETKSIGSKRKAQPAPLPERAPARGLEGHGFTGAESRAIHRNADGGTPKTNMDAQPRQRSAQEMLESMQGAGPKRKGY